ncbi:MAG: monofunctional biosynthetic peptidoglycan transglycosylase [Bacteroidetes bacterium GWB2_41_8]|nr:MAG: monofunctional biosynthetic peptidoglycan transglycosylase [Bacteroidetes bacterium GWB2_41_8]
MRDNLGKRIFRFVWKTALWFFGLSIISVVLFRFIPVPITPLMVIRSVEQIFGDDELRMKHDWVSIDKISKHLPLAVVCSEDQNFMNHSGFDMKAIEQSLEASKKGKRLRGASTISQQTAKNVFLWPGRSWVRKGLEVYFTVLIEFVWSKERIMEVYLNSIEMGNGIYGAEAAANKYWKTSAEKLSRHQAAAIAAILPNPRKYSANPPGPYVQERIGWIVGQMGQWGTLKFK